ncbi:MAG: HlyD family efflux transporter periplasmic adaptor subunit [Calditrichaeota bacterium]|nr:MAG: HlyD family efflux transporter periplasmic adaptor subunit [Calditrichota bacterium]
MVVIGIVLLAFILSFIPYTDSISGKCVIKSKNVWTLSKNENGQIFSQLKSSSVSEKEPSFRFVNFSNSDILNMNLASNLGVQSEVKKGDLVLALNSNKLSSDLEALIYELKIAESKLNLAKSQEQAPIIEEAEKKIRIAESEKEFAQKRFDRAKELLEKEVSSIQNFEQLEFELKEKKLKLEKEKANLQTKLLTSKPEQIEIAQLEIEKIMKEIKLFEFYKSQGNIYSPISGKIIEFQNGSSLCKIVNLDTLSAEIYIPQRHLKRILKDQTAILSFDSYPNEIFEAKIIEIGDEINQSEFGFYVVVKAEILNPERLIKLGMMGFTNIKTGETTILQAFLGGSFSKIGLNVWW